MYLSVLYKQKRQVTDVNKRKLNDISMCFYDKTGDFQDKPKPQSFPNSKRAANRSQDDISKDKVR